jgi:hypothetical protein
MTLRGSEDHYASAPGAEDLAVLAELRAGYQHLRIDIQQWDGFRQVWVGQGENGHPWLLASDDLARFRRALEVAG